MDLPLLSRLAMALALGCVIGLERGWSIRSEVSRTGGDSEACATLRSLACWVAAGQPLSP